MMILQEPKFIDSQVLATQDPGALPPSPTPHQAHAPRYPQVLSLCSWIELQPTDQNPATHSTWTPLLPLPHSEGRAVS